MRTLGLKEGDRVLVSEEYGWHGRRHKPGTVTRKTPSGIVTVTIDAYPPHGTIAHDKVFNADGRERSRGYRGDQLESFSQETLDRELHEAMILKKRRYLEDGELWRSKVPDSVILQIASIVEQAVKP